MQNQSEQKQQVQKGWLSRWTRKQWSRHWFVLKSGSLTYYRGPAAELCSFLDGVLDLSLIKHIEVQQAAKSCNGPTIATTVTTTKSNSNINQQQQQQKQFTFSLKMWNGECHLLGAASLAERSIWLEAINSCTNGCLLDDEASTDSASSTDSSPTSNLSNRSCDIGLYAIRFRNTILSQQQPQQQQQHQQKQQQQQQNDQIAIDKLAMSLRTAIKRREQELRLDFSSSINNNNNNNTSETLKHNKQQTTSQQQQQQQKQLQINKSSTIEQSPPHSIATSQLRDGILKKSTKLIHEKSREAEAEDNVVEDDVDDDDGEDNEEEEDEDEEEEEEEVDNDIMNDKDVVVINDNDDEEQEQEENDKDEGEGEEIVVDDANEADESETDETNDDAEETSNQAFKRRLMCVPQINLSSAIKHSDPKLISRLAVEETDDDDDDDDNNDNHEDDNIDETQKETTKQQEQEQCNMKQRKRVTFDLSQSTQRLLTSSSSSGSSSDNDSDSDSDSDTSSHSYGSKSSESSLGSIEPEAKPNQSKLADLEQLLIRGTLDTNERLVIEPEDGVKNIPIDIPSTCAEQQAAATVAASMCCPMDTTSHDGQVVPMAPSASSSSPSAIKYDTATASSSSVTCLAVNTIATTKTTTTTTGNEDDNNCNVEVEENKVEDEEKEEKGENDDDDDKENIKCLREQVARIEELEMKYERAQESIGLLERRLSNSCASYAQLELTYVRLQSDLVKRDEFNRSEANRLLARIEELQHQLVSSESKLLEARDRLLKFEQAQQLERQQQQQQQQQQRTSATPIDTSTMTTTTNTNTTTTTSTTTTAAATSPDGGQLLHLLSPSSRAEQSVLQNNPIAVSKPATGSWLKQINQQHQHQQQQQQYQHQQKPLFLMHNVRHTLAANQQVIGLKLLNQSKLIQRKLNELELKVDKINQPPAQNAITKVPLTAVVLTTDN